MQTDDENTNETNDWDYNLYNHNEIVDEVDEANSESNTQETHFHEILIENFSPVEKPKIESEISCDICHLKFKTKPEIRNHMATHITQEIKINVKRSPFNSNMERKRHRCTVCRASFWHENSYTTHVETHKITCKFCHEIFPGILDLKRHVKIHNGKKAFICNACGKFLGSKLSLENHLNMHRKQGAYSCEICSKAFYSSTSFQAHLKNHSGRKFGCRICRKEFNWEFDLKRHLKIHTAERPFNCSICGKGFYRKDALNSHSINHK